MWVARTLREIRDAVNGMREQLGGVALWMGDLGAVTGESRRLLRQIVQTQGQHGAQLTGLVERTRNMATQDDVNRITAAIDSATTGIRQDIADLKAAAEAGQDLDFSALDAKVDALAALDAENPAAPVDEGPTV